MCLAPVDLKAATDFTCLVFSTPGPPHVAPRSGSGGGGGPALRKGQPTEHPCALSFLLPPEHHPKPVHPSSAFSPHP